jgi:microcystin-dependent protein
MPVVVTPNLGLTEPEVNVSTGWGGTLNTNLTIIDNIFPAAGNGTSVGINVGTGKVLTAGGTTVFGTNDATASAAAATAVRGPAKTGTNAVGPNLTIQSGNGTGSGGSGSILLQTAPAAASGSTADTMRTGLEIRPTGVVSIPIGLEVLGIDISTLVPPGSMIDYGGSSTPTGWLLCDGSAVSRATYAALFTAISTTWGAGNGTTTFNVPDFRGRVSIGKDNMGGSAANRITNAGSGITGTTLGASGGAQNVTLDTTMIPAHTHTFTISTRDYSGSGGSSANYSAGSGATTITTSSTGGGAAHNNVQPGAVVNKIIKT